HVVSAAREARYIPRGIRETSRRVDRTVRALVEKAKIAQRTLLMLQRLRYAHAAREASRPMSAQPVGAAVSCTDVNPLGRPACPLIRSTIPSTGSSALRKLALLRSSCFVPNFFARRCRDGRGAALVASRLHQFKNDGQPGHNSLRGPMWCHDSDPAWLEL